MTIFGFKPESAACQTDSAIPSISDRHLNLRLMETKGRENARFGLGNAIGLCEIAFVLIVLAAILTKHTSQGGLELGKGG